MMYSPDPVQQAAWRAAGIDGSVSDDDIGVFLLNLGASKLDPYVSMSVEATTQIVENVATDVFRGEDNGEEAESQIRVDLTVSLRNDGRGDLSDFSVGVWEELGLEEPGSYNGRLAIYLPRSTLDLTLPDDVVTEVFGPDGRVLVAAWRLVLAPQSTTQIDFSYVIPTQQAELAVLPSARVPAVAWTWNGDQFLDVERTIVVASP